MDNREKLQAEEVACVNVRVFLSCMRNKEASPTKAVGVEGEERDQELTQSGR